MIYCIDLAVQLTDRDSSWRENTSCKISRESSQSLFICLFAKLFIPPYHLTSDMVNITCLNLVDKELERAQSIIITTEACASLATIADLCA